MFIRLLGLMILVPVLFAGCVSNVEGKKCFFLDPCQTQEEAAADFWLNHA